MSTLTRAALLGVALLLVGLASVGGLSSPSLASTSPIVVLTDSNFTKQVLKDKGLVLVDFYATWCPWCTKLEPNFLAVAEQYQTRMKFGKVNTDVQIKTTNAYNIEYLPTLILFKDGKQVTQQVGYCSEASIKALIKPYL
jgi:thioredoxin 1